jgi:hypothetical protein
MDGAMIERAEIEAAIARNRARQALIERMIVADLETAVAAVPDDDPEVVDHYGGAGAPDQGTTASPFSLAWYR